MVHASTSRIATAASLFDLATGLRMARVAERSYAAPADVERTAVQQWTAGHFRFLDVDGTQCLVIADDQDVVVCFRGTEANRPEDWISDLRFELVDGPLQGRVHAGFYDALCRVWHLLDREVRQLCASGRRRLWVTGHSLGAALATLAVGAGVTIDCRCRVCTPSASRVRETRRLPAISTSPSARWPFGS